MHYFDTDLSNKQTNIYLINLTEDIVKTKFTRKPQHIKNQYKYKYT